MKVATDRDLRANGLAGFFLGVGISAAMIGSLGLLLAYAGAIMGLLTMVIPQIYAMMVVLTVFIGIIFGGGLLLGQSGRYASKGSRIRYLRTLRDRRRALNAPMVEYIKDCVFPDDIEDVLEILRLTHTDLTRVLYPDDLPPVKGRRKRKKD